MKHLVDTCRVRYGVAAAEVGLHDLWQRSELGFAVVANTPAQVEEVLEAVERFVWSHPEIEVTSPRRSWLDTDR